MAGRKIDDLTELLAELGRARSLRGRLRVLGHAWSLLRSLSPSQREQVALRLGSDWAWKRVERAFRADGELSDSERLVGRAFERLRDSDPADLRSLAGTLKQGGAEGARDLLLMTLTEALEEEADEGETDAGSEATPQPMDAPATGLAAPASPASPEVVADAGVVLASSLARQIREHEPEASAAAIDPPAARPSVAPVPPQPGPTRPQPRETTARTSLEVLRQLTRSPRPGAELGRAGRAHLLESLGGGWASRRALARMISARSLDGLDEALALTGQLGSSGQQLWCLADLLAHWPLEADEVARVLEAAPSDAARRRLEQRWRRAQAKPGSPRC